MSGSLSSSLPPAVAYQANKAGAEQEEGGGFGDFGGAVQNNLDIFYGPRFVSTTLKAPARGEPFDGQCTYGV